MVRHVAAAGASLLAACRDAAGLAETCHCPDTLQVTPIVAGVSIENDARTIDLALSFGYTPEHDEDTVAGSVPLGIHSHDNRRLAESFAQDNHARVSA
jgi:hypothetical protein